MLGSFCAWEREATSVSLDVIDCLVSKSMAKGTRSHCFFKHLVVCPMPISARLLERMVKEKFFQHVEEHSWFGFLAKTLQKLLQDAWVPSCFLVYS